MMQVPVDNTNEICSFKKFLNEHISDEKIKIVIDSATIKRVKVNCQKKEWTIFLVCKNYISLNDVLYFSEKIFLDTNKVAKIKIIPYFEDTNIDIKQFFSDYKQYIINILMDRMPVMGSWLNKAKWNFTGNIINLVLPTSTLVQYIEKRNDDKKIVDFLNNYFGINCTIKTCLSEDPVEYDVELMTNITEIDIPKIENNIKTKEVVYSKRNNKQKNVDIILGKAIRGIPFLIENIVEEEKLVILKGIINNLQIRALKSGRNLIIFDLFDNTSGITVKIFENDKNKGFSEKLKEKQNVLVRGSVQQDIYSQELTLIAYDISLTTFEVKMDLSDKKRVELHLHTKMSSLDAMTDVSKVIEKAALWGHKAIAITDHGVVQAFPEAYDAGQKNEIKIIYGVEGYLIEGKEENIKKEKYYHVIILVKNQKGLENLYHLISLSHLKYFYRKPRIPKYELEKYREGLIIGSACEAGELIRGILQDKSDEELEEIAKYYDYLEVQPIGNNEFLVRKEICNNNEDLISINKKVIEIGKKLNKLVVATGDVHFLNSEDQIYRKILMSGQGYEDNIQPPLYYRTTQEMMNEFNYLSSDLAEEIVITNPNLVADMIEDVLPIPKELYPPEIEGAEEQIVEMSKKSAVDLYGENLPKVVADRLDKELNSIVSNGFSVLYLIAQKLVKKSNDDGYLVGSRGSVGSSFVATMTGITEVNPLPPHYICPNCKNSEFILDGSYNCGVDMPDKVCSKCGIKYTKNGYDIPFETFLGFKGDKVPDIDLNFSGDYQPRAHKFIEELFGKDYVFRAGTISTIAERTAYGFVKNYFDDKEHRARNAEINRLVSGCTGVKKTTGQHPGGLMVVPKYTDIHKFTPLQRPADDVKSETITTHFDYHSISSRLVKLDILGHDDPTVIKMLEDLTGVDAKEISLEDTKTMSLFSSTEALGVKPEDINSNTGTFGIPEFGTKFVRQMLEDTKPKTFSELVRISGFSHGTDVWLNNAQDLIRTGTAKVSEAISTRDDIMIYLIHKNMESVTAFKIMEDVRKGRGLKPEQEEAMIKNSVPDWYIESCKKIKYMFPKAHAVAYVTMAFRIAYFKVYYPEAFYASFYTVRADEFDAILISQGIDKINIAMKEIEGKGKGITAKEKNLYTILEITLEMYKRGIELLKVDIWKSEANKFQIVDGNILPPFSAVQGLGQTAAENMVKARAEKKFTSIEDLKVRGKVTKTTIEILKEHGCLNKLPESDQLSLF